MDWKPYRVKEKKTVHGKKLLKTTWIKDNMVEEKLKTLHGQQLVRTFHGLQTLHGQKN